jgi:DNA-binding MarR family transcriptional regulator
VTRTEGPPSLLYAVKQVELAVRARLDEGLRGSGITVPQWTALTVLARREGQTSAELARNAFVSA